MPFTFSVKVTPDGTIILPDEHKDLSDQTITVTINVPTEKTRAKIMKFAGIFEGMTDKDLGLDDFEERRGRLVGKESD